MTPIRQRCQVRAQLIEGSTVNRLEEDPEDASGLVALALALTVLAQAAVQLQGIDMSSLRALNAASICHEMIPLSDTMLDHDKKLNNAPTYGPWCTHPRISSHVHLPRYGT
jgi:hypothetical protein